MSGQLIWFVAFLLYVYDSISLNDRAAVLRYSVAGVTAMLMMPTLTIGRCRIFIPNPLRPDHCDLMLTSECSAELASLDRYFIARASGMYLMHH